MFLFEQLIETGIQQTTPGRSIQQVVPVSTQGQIEQPLDTQQDYADEEEMEDEEMEDDASDSSPPDFIPIKKYYLLQKLMQLQDQLKMYNISDSDLNLVLKFADNLSYNSLLILSNQIIQYLEEKLAEKISNS